MLTSAAKGGSSKPLESVPGGCESCRDRDNIDVTEKQGRAGEGPRTPGESVLLVLVRTQAGEGVAAVPPAKQALKPWDWHLPA